MIIYTYKTTIRILFNERLLKDLGYTSINYTSKINSINQYIQMVNKINLPLFEKKYITSILIKSKVKS